MKGEPKKGRYLAAAAAIVLGLAMVAEEAVARNNNPAYYGTDRGVSARRYSGQWRAQNPLNVPTFSLPVYGGGVYYGRRFGGRRFFRGPLYYQQPIVYPPVIVYGY